MISLDFETRSEANIWDVGAWEYAAHPSTEVLCLVYAVNDREPVLVTDFSESIEPGRYDHYEAHNAFFEQSIYENIMVKRYGWPEIDPKRWRCSAAKCMAHALPRSLENAGKALGSKIQKNLVGRRTMLKMCKPRPKWWKDPTTPKWHEDPEDFKILYEYCKQDVLAEREISKALRDLNPTEQQVWFLDQKINRKGVQIDIPAVNTAIDLVEEYTISCTKEIQEISEGYLNNVSQIARVKMWAAMQGFPLNDLTKATVTATIKNPDIPENLRKILKLRQQLGKTSVKKYMSMVNATSDIDGRLRDTLMYHGATTGRWAGKLVQLHNLPKGTVKDTYTCIETLKENDLEWFQAMYPDVMGAISSCIRGMIIAKPGYELLVADYAAIEARVLLWLADHKKGLGQFRKGEDLYVDLAKEIYKKEEINSDERQLGKTAILGCGYGMGHKKFLATCQSWGIEISPTMAERVVNTYRETYKEVKGLWYAQEKAAIQSVAKRGSAIVQGKVKWGCSKTFLFCQLPSGRRLAYPYPELKKVMTPWGETKTQLTFMGTNSKTKQWERQGTYGGKIVENITQGVARDIMAEAMLHCDKIGIPITLSIHDELVAETKINEYSVRDFTEAISTLPPWALGCPITAEGWKGPRYKK